MFVATKTKSFVAASIILSRQNTSFVATKMILAADSRRGKMKERMLLMLLYNAVDDVTVGEIPRYRNDRYYYRFVSWTACRWRWDVASSTRCGSGTGGTKWERQPKCFVSFLSALNSL